MPVTTSTLLEAINRSGILPPEGKAKVRDVVLGSGATDEESLSEALVDAGVITRFQCDELLAGRYRRLRIDRYVLTDLLGLGGMGSVYRAIDTATNSLVALKVLSEHFKHDAGMRARFRLEARIGMLARHEHLVRTLALGQTDDVFGEVDYMVMDLFEAIALHELISLRGPLDWRSACDVISQAAVALDYLHAQGWVHRDVKPDNLLIDADGQVKLVDFGLAFLGTSLCDEEFSLAMIFGHDCLGTADYMPPEQADDSMQADRRSDVYALGATLYAALTGSRPYGNKTRSDAIQAHRSQPPPSAQQSRPQLPDVADQMIARMMAKRPEERFADMTQVQQALAPYAQRKPVRFEFAKILRMRARLAERRRRGLRTTASNIRSSSISRINSSIVSATQPPAKVETAVARPKLGREAVDAGDYSGDAAGDAARAAGMLIEGIAPATGDVSIVPARLVFDDGTIMPLVRSGYSMGRATETDLNFDAPDLSGRHCQLSFDGSKWWISDLDSKNGVRVNGKLVKDHVLRSGDQVKLGGSVSFRVELRRRGLALWVWLVLAAVVGAVAVWVWWSGQ